MDLKDLDKFLKICRKQGVTVITFEGVSVTFGDLPRKESTAQEPDEVPTDGLSDDELMFYHLNGGKEV